MDLLAVCVVSIVIILSLLFWMNKIYKSKLANVLNELKFFKKEKEFYAEAMVVFSKDYEILFANQSAKELFSLSNKGKKGFELGTTVELQFSSMEPVDFFKAIEKKSIASENSFQFKDVVIITEKEKKIVNIYVDKSEWNIDNTVTCIVETPVQNLIAKKDGKVDFLTGLSSQFSSLAEINSLAMESQKKSETFSLFLLGIDNYDSMQTTLGHHYTNQIIKRIANYFIEHTDDSRDIYRMDCDKFLLVLKRDMDDETIYKIASELIIDIENYCKGDDYVRLTTSFGIAKYPTHGANATKLINHVYVALDTAQKEGESNIELFSQERQAMRKDDIKMNEEIVSGLKNSEFLLHYQPIFSLKNGDMIAAEALIRWNHPTYGLISPERFLHVAEKTGLIVDIGEYVFRDAMKQRKIWDELGFKKFRITLNLSLREMQVDKLIKKLDKLFIEYAVDPLDFNLDITEKDAMANIDKTATDFKLFKDLGLYLSLDHFGAGYSSIKYLQILPISMLKIDRSLIFDLSTNLDHQMAVKGIIELAHTLGYEVVAEGVETKKESTILHELGCDHAQGYLFSKPIPVFEFQSLLR